jgi:hypothetical protein
LDLSDFSVGQFSRGNYLFDRDSARTYHCHGLHLLESASVGIQDYSIGKLSMKTKIVFSVLLAVTVAGSLYAQVRNKKARELADYTLRTLQELAQSKATTSEPINEDLVIQGDIVLSRIRVVYEGTSRPLSQNRKDVVREWARRFAGAPEFYTQPYETEVLFSENGENYWLAVRKEFLPRFEQELKKTEAVDLFVIKLGNVRTGEKWEPVLLVEKFAKPQGV